jgi:hypothetical protein
MRKLLILMLLFVSIVGQSQTLKYDTIVTTDGSVAIGDIVEVIENVSNFTYFLRFYNNKSVDVAATQPKTIISTYQISYVIWDGVRIEGTKLKPVKSYENFVINDNSSGNLLVDNGSKKIRAGGIIMAIGGAFMASGVIMSTQSVDYRISTGFMIVGGVSMTFGGSFIASGVTRSEKVRMIGDR